MLCVVVHGGKGLKTVSGELLFLIYYYQSMQWIKYVTFWVGHIGQCMWIHEPTLFDKPSTSQ